MLQKIFFPTFIIFFSLLLNISNVFSLSDVEKVRRIAFEWEASVNRMDVERFASFYAEKIVFHGQRISKQRLKDLKHNAFSKFTRFKTRLADVRVVRPTWTSHLIYLWAHKVWEGDKSDNRFYDGIVYTFFTFQNIDGEWKITVQRDQSVSYANYGYREREKLIVTEKVGPYTLEWIRGGYKSYYRNSKAVVQAVEIRFIKDNVLVKKYNPDYYNWISNYYYKPKCFLRHPKSGTDIDNDGKREIVFYEANFKDLHTVYSLYILDPSNRLNEKLRINLNYYEPENYSYFHKWYEKVKD